MMTVVTDHQRTANIYCGLDKNYKYLMPYVKTKIMPKLTRKSLHLKRYREGDVYTQHCKREGRRGEFWSSTDEFWNELGTAMRWLIKNKPNFLKKHIKLMRWRYDKYVSVYSINMTEQMWSFLQQFFEFESRYLEHLFSETALNKRKKEQEVNDLIEKTFKDMEVIVDDKLD